MSGHDNNRDHSGSRPIGYPVRHRRKVPFRPEPTMDMVENTRVPAVNAKRAKGSSFQEASSWVNLGKSSARGRLDELVEMGIPTKAGRTRSMRYRFDDPLGRIRETAGMEETIPPQADSRHHDIP